MGAGQTVNQKAMRHGVQIFDQYNWHARESILKRTNSTAKLHIAPEQCKPIATYSSEKYAFLVDEYSLDPAQITNLDECFREIEWRNQCQYLANVKYIKGFSQSFVCETSSPKNYVYIEHTPLRLSQITDIPFPDNLYLLKACLQGFHYIFLHTHALDIKEDHICINQQAKVKVWMHPNLSKNTPSLPNAFKTGRKSELTLVRELINMVDENTDDQYEPKNFKQYLLDQRLQNLTFSEAIQAVQHFAAAFNIVIPSSLQSIIGLFDPYHSEEPMMANFHHQQQPQNSYEMSRGAETKQTQMIQSVPLQQIEHSTIIYSNNINPQFITHFDTYKCPLRIEKQYNLPFQQTKYPVKVNFITKMTPPQPQNVSVIQTKAVFPQKIQTKQEDWRYYDVNGWLDIDPEILKDLKQISSLT